MASITTVSAPPLLQLDFSMKRNRSSKRPLTRLKASVSETTSLSVEETPTLPLRKIPGDYGIPIVGPIKDRLDYFYNQGRDIFFQTRIQKYQSTVFRANMPPGPFISSNPNVVVLLDAKSFPVLFDVTKVEKRDVFTGTFMPSTDLTGGYRILSYLDPSEPKHEPLKRLMFSLLKSRTRHVIPEFRSTYTTLFDTLEKRLAANGKASFAEANDQAAFNFLGRALYGSNPTDTNLGRDGPSIVQKWVLFQLSPILVLGLPKLIEDPIFHTFRLPPFLIKKDYQRLYDFFYESSGSVLDEAVRLGLSKEEACHNLLFATCFNSFGGIKIFFPTVLKWIARAGVKLHARLAEEVRSAVKSNGSEVSMAAMEAMPLMKSVVYEAFRIEPPVPLQYGKAKKDLVVESHENAFLVKEGEMLFGFQPFATKDPKIFERGDEFVADRFVGEGEKMLKHVLWSNGPETEEPSVCNKQCAGKDFVMLFSRLLVVELFLRYDSFDIQVERSPLGSAVTFTSLKRASF
ncbi:allene oxide synthase 1, chloroplastic-like [Abrus precatorius]|uniref:Allene oxide synthase 1, chloroplastic-like n=1 Tax=Abrus precatorius TaxID=3816 RepID=A0A8B8LIZ3_ABRPR|nr:allene oxide synthase 1, chloroplastic-like [Abrus precatorius]